MAHFDEAERYSQKVNFEDGTRYTIGYQAWHFLREHNSPEDRDLIVKLLLHVTSPLVFRALGRPTSSQISEIDIPVLQPGELPPNTPGVYLIASDEYGYVGSAFAAARPTINMPVDEWPQGLRVRLRQHAHILSLGPTEVFQRRNRGALSIHVLFSRSVKKPVYRILSMYPSSPLRSPLYLKNKILGLLDENIKIILFGTLQRNDTTSPYMMRNIASLEFAHTLRRSLEFPRPLWSTGGNRALPVRDYCRDVWGPQEHLIVGLIFEKLMRGHESDEMRIVDAQRAHKRLIAEGFTRTLGAVCAYWKREWKHILGLTPRFQLLLKQTQIMAFAIKSSVAKLSLVAGPLNGFYVVADTEEIRWDLIAREVNQFQSEPQRTAQWCCQWWQRMRPWLLYHKNWESIISMCPESFNQTWK